jgi:class 3 adenylate cyclase/DNA-binding NarL/FixJ family response regulator
MRGPAASGTMTNVRPTTRTVTLLFTDIVGSTDLLTRLGPAAGESARSNHFAGMRGALAVHRGREVKNLGDGFMAAFESAGDALGCAVTMQRTVATQNRRHPDWRLSIRIGVSAGEATYEDGDYFGAPVIEASRLCAVAEPDQILAAEIVRILVGNSGMHRLAPAGAFELKGLPSPVAAWEVDWDAEADSTLRVALADDSVLLREGIASVLESAGIEVVLQVSDADALIDQLVAARAHVAVVDVRMPPTHTTEGLRAAERIRSEHPEIGVLVLSQSVEPRAARRLLGGATDGIGYLLKERILDVSELTSAIRTVASGGSAIDPLVVEKLTRDVAEAAASPAAVTSP